MNIVILGEALMDKSYKYWYMVDRPNNRILLLDLVTKNSVGSFGSLGTGDGEFTLPTNLVVI